MVPDEYMIWHPLLKVPGEKAWGIISVVRVTQKTLGNTEHSLPFVPPGMLIQSLSTISTNSRIAE
jgi:hypothetical protein